MSLLDQIKRTGDIRKIDPEDYDALAAEIREFLVKKVSEHGGHLASNLGAVELTMALHLAYDPAYDKIIWDVGHQCYTHKLLTGRRAGFDSLREFGGMSGFPKRRESGTDVYETGHSTTSLSAALGMVEARDLFGDHYHVVAVIGDGSATGGMAFEAMNNASEIPSNFVIVLNDNNMSISPSKGGLKKHLSNIRVAKGYNDLKEDVADRLSRVRGGEHAIRVLKRMKGHVKHAMIGDTSIFDNLGLTYIGPIDGHDVRTMAHVFRQVRNINHPVLVHVVTQKGRGYAPARKHPDIFHGVSKFDPETGKPCGEKTLTYTDVFSKTITRLGAEHSELVCITAAMREGVGLTRFARKFPDRFFDVGIAEEHAVTFAAGMAACGLRPVVAVYSTFLQRAYDQIMMDVCLQELPVIFAIDRAGLVGADGETHQGAYDLSYLSHMPNMTVIAPGDVYELEAALEFAVSHAEGPIAIRYPRGGAEKCEEIRSPFEYGKGVIVKEGHDIAILAVGSMLRNAWYAAEILEQQGFAPTVVNARFVKPLDTGMLDRLAETHGLIVTYEDNAVIGGFGDMTDVYMLENHPDIHMLNLGIPDSFVEHGSVDRLQKKLGLDPESAAARIRDAWRPEN